MRTLLSAFIALLTLTAAGAHAEETRVSVFARSADAKFIGDGMGGMTVVLENADTGEVLASGVTRGGTGDTGLLVPETRERYADIVTEDAARFTATLDIERPMRVRATVAGPNGQRQAGAEASQVRWILPGRHLEGDLGWIVEVPGLAVDILSPPAHQYVSGGPETMEIAANVVFLCGCGTSPEGVWDADALDIVAEVRRDGAVTATHELDYAGERSQYAVEIDASEPGLYTVTVTAFDRRTGNSGADFTSFIIREE
ncbi:hypothetical protein DDZ18_13335 [Marinicauda salina]|uniref:Uncharacterized protein n=1 Tax=Marinicauda salina TaxID=2135793 RepID=A0A2U2BQX9_9PROT|nr:hypothetical protein [Marinicauda salina]PWE16399.1 hypothetical protein DDZ18_13335 [Marinicauda salina]